MERYRLAKTVDTAETHEHQPKKKIRGRPFQPGNPGRPRGARNRTTQLVEQLLDGEAETLTRKFIELASAGNPRLLQFYLDRLLPRRNGRAVEFQLPPINNVHDVVAATAAITTAVNDGHVTAEEAAQLVKVVNTCAEVLRTRDFIARLEALETRMKDS